MTGVIVGAIVEQLDWPGTREEKGARGVKGTVVGEKGGMENPKEQLTPGVGKE